MKLDAAYYLYPGKEAACADAAFCVAEEGILSLGHTGYTAFEANNRACAAICDGHSDTLEASAASAWCAERLARRMESRGKTPLEALRGVDQELSDREAPSFAADARVSCTCMCTDGAECIWASVGNTRLFHLSGLRVQHVTPDTTEAFLAYASGRCEYADLRLHPQRKKLTSFLGCASAFAPKFGGFSLSPGDAVLLCSDGFWDYVYETEAEIDLSKSTGARDWLGHMLLRHVQRTQLETGAFSALALVCV